MASAGSNRLRDSTETYCEPAQPHRPFRRLFTSLPPYGFIRPKATAAATAAMTGSRKQASRMMLVNRSSESSAGFVCRRFRSCSLAARYKSSQSSMPTLYHRGCREGQAAYNTAQCGLYAVALHFCGFFDSIVGLELTVNVMQAGDIWRVENEIISFAGLPGRPTRAANPAADVSKAGAPSTTACNALFRRDSPPGRLPDL